MSDDRISTSAPSVEKKKIGTKHKRRVLPGMGNGAGNEDLDDQRKLLNITSVPDFINIQMKEHRECSEKKKGPGNDRWHAESICGVHHWSEDFVVQEDTPSTQSGCTHWIVSVASRTSLKRVPRIPTGWCCVVVVDGGALNVSQHCHVLDQAMQQKLSLQLVTLLAGVSGPARRQALKNVGFLYAIQNGAKVIAEAELSAIAMVSSIPVLREFHTMAGEEDSPSVLMDPWRRFQLRAPCGLQASSGRSEPYYAFHDGGGISSSPVQQPVFSAQLSPQSVCMCRSSWNKFHSSCRKRFKKCSIFSENHPVVPRRNESFAIAAFGAFLTIYTYRAFWALLIPRNGNLVLRSLWMQRLLWGIHGVPIFYNASSYTTVHPSAAAAASQALECNSQSDTADLERVAEALKSALIEVESTTYELLSSLASGLREIVPGINTAQDNAWTQAWLADLERVGYRHLEVHRPMAQMGAIVTLLDESERDIMKFIWFWYNYRFALNQHYPLWMFYIDGTLEEAEKKAIIERVPGFEVKFFPVQYFVPTSYWRSYNQWALNGSKGYGYIYCSQFLGYEMFRHPAFETLQFYMRVDEDTHSPKKAPVLFDPFVFMKEHNVQFATSQIGIHSIELDNSISSAAWQYVRDVLRDAVSPTWIRAQAFYAQENHAAWDRWIYAGCIEFAMVRLYQTPEFRDFMWRSDWVRGVYLHSWLEQATKTVWPLLVASPSEWRYFCELVVYHRWSLTGDQCGAPLSLRPVMEMLAPPDRPPQCLVRYYPKQREAGNPLYRPLPFCQRPAAKMTWDIGTFKREFKFSQGCCVQHLYEQLRVCCAVSGAMQACASLGVCVEKDPLQGPKG
eukprot:EG_transcript_2340